MKSSVIQDINILKLKSTDATAEEAVDIIKKLEIELSNHNTGIGLSAIQIGIPKRVAIVRSSKNIDLINPTITDESDSFINLSEMCLSCPNKKINVTRYKSITLNNMIIRDGKLEESIHALYMDDNYEYTDGLAVIAVQHEIDHMDGILIVDKSVEVPTINVIKVPNRNDACPCGSGKKYKKCCINKGV